MFKCVMEMSGVRFIGMLLVVEVLVVIYYECKWVLERWYELIKSRLIGWCLIVVRFLKMF